MGVRGVKKKKTDLCNLFGVRIDIGFRVEKEEGKKNQQWNLNICKTVYRKIRDQQNYCGLFFFFFL